jgi:hypothetical protein
MPSRTLEIRGAQSSTDEGEVLQDRQNESDTEIKQIGMQRRLSDELPKKNRHRDHLYEGRRKPLLN